MGVRYVMPSAHLSIENTVLTQNGSFFKKLSIQKNLKLS